MGRHRPLIQLDIPIRSTHGECPEATFIGAVRGALLGGVRTWKGEGRERDGGDCGGVVVDESATVHGEGVRGRGWSPWVRCQRSGYRHCEVL